MIGHDFLWVSGLELGLTGWKRSKAMLEVRIIMTRSEQLSVL